MSGLSKLIEKEMKNKFPDVNIEQEINNHKFALCSFNLEFPKANASFISQKILKSAPMSALWCWIKVYRYELQRDITLLELNYQKEKGDLTKLSKKCSDDYYYLIAAKEFNTSYKISARIKYVGYIHIEDEGICVAYLHPFLRNQGIMTAMIKWHHENVHLLQICPPLSKEMEIIVNKILDAPLTQKHVEDIIKSMKKFGINVDDFNINIENAKYIFNAFKEMQILTREEDVDINAALRMKLKVNETINSLSEIDRENLKKEFQKQFPSITDEIKYEFHKFEKLGPSALKRNSKKILNY